MADYHAVHAEDGMERIQMDNQITVPGDGNRSVTRSFSMRIHLLLAAIVCVSSFCMADDKLQIKVDKNGKRASLSLNGSSAKRVEVTSDIMEDILEFDDAESLSLFGTSTTDSDVAKIAELKGLRSLDLSYTAISDNSADSLARLEGLQILKLEGTEISDQTLAVVANLPSLSMLHLAKTKITDQGLKLFHNHKTLNVLDLSSCNISNEGLRTIGKPPMLQCLCLAKTVRYGESDRSNLTDDCLEYLLSLDTLIDLDIANSKISEEGVERLREGLKRCNVSTTSHGVVYLDRKKK